MNEEDKAVISVWDKLSDIMIEFSGMRLRHQMDNHESQTKCGCYFPSAYEQVMCEEFLDMVRGELTATAEALGLQ